MEFLPHAGARKIARRRLRLRDEETAAKPGSVIRLSRSRQKPAVARHGLLVSSAAASALVALTLAATFQPVAAQQTETRSFDALGRLITTVTAGGPNDQDTRSLCYDEMGNREQFRASPDGTVANCAPPPPPPPTPPPPPPTPPPPPPPPPPSNQPPNAQNDSVSGLCGEFTVLNLTANDSDPDGHYPLVLVSISVGSGAAATATIFSASSVEVQFGSVQGTTGFNYTVRDSLGATDVALLEVNSSQCGGGEIPP